MQETDQGPSDPITGVFKSVHGTVGGIVQGIVDYPVEISKIVQADGDVAKGLAADFALDSNKGVSRIIGTGLRAPGDFTMNISRGFANAPKLYGDETVRPVEKVDGVVSGLEAAGKVSLCFYLLVSSLLSSTCPCFVSLPSVKVKRLGRPTQDESESSDLQSLGSMTDNRILLHIARSGSSGAAGLGGGSCASTGRPAAAPTMCNKPDSPVES